MEVVYNYFEMRKEQTSAEKIITESISDFIYEDFKQKIKIDHSIIDRPDLVFTTESNKKIGIEITRLGYEKFMKWLSKGTSLNQKREAQIVVNLAKQIPTVLNKKNKKYKEYKKNHSLSEVWLCLHNDLYEFGKNQLNKDLFCKDVRFYCWTNKCNFDRVIFYSENTKEYTLIYNKKDSNPIAKPSPFHQTIEFIQMTARVTSEGWSLDVLNTKLQDKKKFN